MTDKQTFKGVLSEWILTNGELEGFRDRLAATRKLWSVVGPAGMVVYRGQGGFIKPPAGTTATPNTLVAGVRPLLATTTKLEAAKEYTGDDCCLYRITLKPGVPYVNMKRALTFETDKGETACVVKNEYLGEIARRTEGWTGKWPRPHTPPFPMRQEIIKRCTDEDEILVYADGLVFGDATPIDPPLAMTDDKPPKPIASFDVTIGPLAGGRGRTFRRKPKRMNKNGSRLARKSKRHVRDRHA